MTGSNSTFLSGEPATLLTGRTVEFEILPFSCSEAMEYLSLLGKGPSADSFQEFVKIEF